MGTAHLYIDDAAIESGRRSGLLTFADGSALTLWYEVDGVGACPPRPGADPFVLGTWLLFDEGAAGSFHIQGSVSRRLLSGLTEFQDAWMRWRSGRAIPVSTSPPTMFVAILRNPKAVVAFSGGVDVSFSFRRHLTGDAGWRTVDLRAAILMHGFDIPVRRNRHIRPTPACRAEKMVPGSGVGVDHRPDEYPGTAREMV